MLQSLPDRSRHDALGQGLAEYALILGLVAMLVIAVMTLMGTNIDGVLSTIAVTL